MHDYKTYMYRSDTTFLVLSQDNLFTADTLVYLLLKTDKPVHKEISEEKISYVI